MKNLFLKFSLIIVIIFLLTACLYAKKVKIIKTYSGMASFGMDMEGNFKLIDNMIIKNNDDYEKLINMIPKKQMIKKEPAPDNDDPLLQKPEIDFSKNMIIAVFSHDVNMFLEIQIKKIEIKGKKMIIYIYREKPNPKMIVSKIIDYGWYQAVLIPKFEGKIIFK